MARTPNRSISRPEGTTAVDAVDDEPTTVLLPDLDRGDVTAALADAGAALVALLRGLEPTDGARPVPASGWTAADTAAHVVTVVRRGLGDMRRSATPGATAELNAQCLDELRTRDVHELATLLESDLARMLRDVVPAFPDDALPVPFHGGVRMALLGAYCVVLGELVVHGVDVADATGRTLPIDPRAFALVLRGIWPLLPAWAEPGAADGRDETWAIRLRGDDDALLVTFRHGVVHAGAGPTANASHVLDVEPVAFGLAFPYRRRPAPDPLVDVLAARFQPV